MDRFLDFAHPFFKPIWRRVAVVCVCAFMALLELTNNAPVWAVIFAAMGGVSYWKLFLDPETKAKLDQMRGDDDADRSDKKEKDT